jgi:hypothetical protein
MFIGPRALETLEGSREPVSAFDNPIFGIKQALVDDEPASLRVGFRESLKKTHVGGPPHQPKLLGDFTRLEEIFVHPGLYEAYPQLKDLPIVDARDLPADSDWEREWSGVLAAYIAGNGKSNLIAIGPVDGIKDLKPVMLHELQHAIQDQEDYFAGAIISPDRDKQEDLALYYASPQEREALNVEARVLGSRKIWFRETNPKSAGYPKRLALDSCLRLLEEHLEPGAQKRLFELSLEIKRRKLQELQRRRIPLPPPPALPHEDLVHKQAEDEAQIIPFPKRHRTSR